MKEELIAPCGMNCGICMAFLRKERRCPGCHGEITNVRTSRSKCVIKNCETIRTNGSGFCFECAKFPCRRLRQLDMRYRTKYAMSMIENLEHIRDNGLAAFVEKERERWRCPECSGTICVHHSRCYDCGAKLNLIQGD